MLYNLLLLGLIIFIAIFTLIAGIGAAPSVPTPKKAVDKMVKAMGIKKSRIYYDLGAGDGRIVHSISRRHGIGIGFEYTPQTYLLAKLLQKKRGNKKARIFWKNFYRIDYQHARGVFCFLSPKAMEKLEKKFEEELLFGAKVVSYAFELPNKKPKEIIKQKGLAPIYVYQY